MKSFKILFITGIFLLSTSGLFAQYENDDDVNKNVKIEKRRFEKGKPGMPDELKLTDQQKTEIKKIRLNTKKLILPLRSSLVEKRAHLKTLSVAEKVNMDEINKTIDEISGLMAQIMKKREAAKQEIRKLLTEEQRIIFDTRPAFNQKMRRRIIKEIHEN